MTPANGLARDGFGDVCYGEAVSVEARNANVLRWNLSLRRDLGPVYGLGRYVHVSPQFFSVPIGVRQRQGGDRDHRIPFTLSACRSQETGYHR